MSLRYSEDYSAEGKQLRIQRPAHDSCHLLPRPRVSQFSNSYIHDWGIVETVSQPVVFMAFSVNMNVLNSVLPTSQQIQYALNKMSLGLNKTRHAAVRITSRCSYRRFIYSFVCLGLTNQKGWNLAGKPGSSAPCCVRATCSRRTTRGLSCG